MGGGAMPEAGGKSRKKSLDAMINVVPAIDLLSCCIAFLLYTAVWTQISRLQVQQMGSSEAPPPDQKMVTVTLALTERGFALSSSAGTSITIPNLGRNPDGGPVYDVKTLTERLTQLKRDYADVTAITVAAEDNVLYSDLVSAVDVCIGAQFVNVTVTAAG
jgi:biopolymer transport protein TolR